MFRGVCYYLQAYEGQQKEILQVKEHFTQMFLIHER